jgi:hypothetical protein
LGRYREWKIIEFPKYYCLLIWKQHQEIPRNKWKDEVREGGRIVSGEEWQEKVYDREE